MTSTGDTMKDAEDVGPPPAPVDWRKKNPLKALFFAQVSPLIREGTVRRLEPTDLCHLEKLDSERVRLGFRRARRFFSLHQRARAHA